MTTDKTPFEKALLRRPDIMAKIRLAVADPSRLRPRRRRTSK